MNHLSWERSNLHEPSSSNSTYNSSKAFNQTKSSRFKRDRSSKTKSDLSLLAFGYSCKLFKDDEQARYLDQGKNLVEWSGDSNSLIDRFDVRSYLSQNELERYAAKVGVNYRDLLTEEEIELEKKLDKERYKDLYSLEEETENNKETIDQDEEMKKWKESVEEKDKKGNQFQFNYENLEQSYKNDANQSVVEKPKSISPDDEKFVLPDGLDLPPNILLPFTVRENNLIEKTAKFISKQGDQMEIILKTKQSSNSQFDFLNYDSPLNPYYKCLVKLIRDDKYKPNNPNDKQKQDESESSEESDNGDNYLHPFLQANKQSSNYDLQLINNVNRPTNSIYSKLAENLKDKISVVDKSYYEPKVIESKGVKYDLNNKDNTQKKPNQLSKGKTNNQTSIANQPPKVVQSVFDLMPEIPPEIKLIIEKLAQYVCKNGEEFEKTVRSRNENRFDFLNPGHKFHFYYVKTKLKLLESKRKETVNNNNNLTTNSDCSSSKNLVTSEPIEKSSDKLTNEFDSSQKVVPFMISNKRQTFKDDLEAKMKEKQEERKRKAALFLSKLKQQKVNNESNEEITIGPKLPVENKAKQERESFRNTPSPLKEFFDGLNVKEDRSKDSIQSRKDSFDELKLRQDLNLNGNSSPELDRASFKRKSAKREHYRKRESSASGSDNRSKSPVDNLRERSVSSSHRFRSSSREKHHRSSRHRSRTKSRSRSRSPRRHKRRSHHRSRSRDKHRSRDRHSRSPRKRH